MRSTQKKKLKAAHEPECHIPKELQHQLPSELATFETNLSHLKKITAIVLFTVFFLSQAGYLLLIQYQVSSWKEEMQFLIDNNLHEDVVIISLEDNISRIHWEKNGREFSLNGELYDVVVRTKSDGKNFLHCVHDKEEKRLKEHAHNIIKKNLAQAKKQLRTMLPVYVKAHTEQILQCDLLDIPAFNSMIQEPVEGNLQISFPPPRV